MRSDPDIINPLKRGFHSDSGCLVMQEIDCMYVKHTLGSIRQRLHGPKAEATSTLGSTLRHGEGRSSHLGFFYLKEGEIDQELQLDFEIAPSSAVQCVD